MKAERRKKWAQRGLAAALTLLILAVLPALRTLALCPGRICAIPEETIPLAVVPTAETGLTELQRNGNFLLWLCSGLAILVQAVLEICRGSRGHQRR